MFPTKAWVRGASILVLFAAVSAHAAPGDMNNDGDIDLTDYGIFKGCLTDPQQATGPSCQPAKFDGDADVDLREIAGFWMNFTGSCDAPRAHNGCHCPNPVSDGTTTYSNLGATTDGPSEDLCTYADDSQIHSDLWFCYTATCTGTAFVGLCGSDHDTKLAVYSGCGCPSASPLACSDDDCGSGIENLQSRVEIAVTFGQEYMIRAGGFDPVQDQGDGLLTIGCNVDNCATGTGNCFVPSPTGQPGCGDAACCASTCDLDQYCCDVEWDEFCAAEAQGACTGTFPACTPAAGACGTPHDVGEVGCSDVDCCNTVCFEDPYCCITTWDANCVDEAEELCFLTCGSPGGCFSVHVEPGCSDVACCQLVCTEDPICCSRTWDPLCVALAGDLCP